MPDLSIPLAPPSQPLAGEINPTVGEDRLAARRLVLVITFLLIFGMAARTPLDTDMWWHLRAGDELLRMGRWLNSDLFSLTRTGAHWVNAFWLTDAVFALLFRWGGFLALSAVTATLAVTSMWLVWRQCQGPVFMQAVALLLGSVVASVVWSPRPQIVSLVLMALVGYVLYLYKWRQKDALWALPLVFVLWANTHGGYPLGLILIGMLLAGEILNHMLGLRGDEVVSWGRLLRLAVWTLACGAAVLLNPNGLDMWRLPFQTVNMQVLQQFIPEWASPDFHQLLQQSMLWLLLAAFAAAALAGRVMDATDLLTLLAFASMALLARRNYGPFAVAAVPILTRYAVLALDGWQSRVSWRLAWLSQLGVTAPASPGSRRIKKIVNLLLVALIGLIAFGKLYAVSHPALVGSYITDGYPARAVSWLVKHQPHGRVLNEYNWGGFLQWQAPGFQIFVDGRTDLFGDQVIGEWISVVQAQPGWQALLDRYQVNLVMLEPGRPLLKELPSEGWTLLYQDDQAVIYGR